LYKERLISITRKGMNGQKEIADMMERFRKNPPNSLNGSKVVSLLDYDSGENKNLLTAEKKKIELPRSNVLQFILEDGSKISARPSGTEPKSKFYFSVKGKLVSREEFDEKEKELESRIDAIIKELGI